MVSQIDSKAEQPHLDTGFDLDFQTHVDTLLEHRLGEIFFYFFKSQKYYKKIDDSLVFLRNLFFS